MNNNPAYIQLTNPLLRKYKKKKGIILFSHFLMGTVRAKSANGLIIHSKLFHVKAIVDKNAFGKKTSAICPGVNRDVPIFSCLSEALDNHEAEAVVFLIPPSEQWYSEIEFAIEKGLDIINTSFKFLNHIPRFQILAKKYKTDIFDLRDVAHQKAYPTIEILNRKSKVIYVTGTDCGLGKRTAAYQLTLEARKNGMRAAMYATGQTGLMLGECGTVVDALITEFSNGVISQHICQMDKLGYELIFIEGQSDIFHPANSAVAIALLHGANPDCIVLVHDEYRTSHKGFEEDSLLYSMHPVTRYIDALEMLSLPCGPTYKTIAIATKGEENIDTIKNIDGINNLTIADVLMPGGAAEILAAIMEYASMNTIKESSQT